MSPTKHSKLKLKTGKLTQDCKVLGSKIPSRTSSRGKAHEEKVWRVGRRMGRRSGEDGGEVGEAEGRRLMDNTLRALVHNIPHSLIATQHNHHPPPPAPPQVPPLVATKPCLKVSEICSTHTDNAHQLDFRHSKPGITHHGLKQSIFMGGTQFRLWK